MTRHHSCRVSPFGHPRIHARLAAPRGISQPPTSFIGSQCQGIHHAPLNTYNTDKPNKEKNCTSNTHNKTFPNRNPERILLRARCSQPLSTNQTPHPTTKVERQPVLSPVSPTGRRDSGLVVSKPNSVSDDLITEKSSPKAESRSGSTFVVHQTPTHYRRKAIHRIA